MHTMFPIQNKKEREILEKIKLIEISSQYVMISLDVKSLYTSVSIKTTMDILQKHWNDIENHTPIDKILFFKIIKFCVDTAALMTFENKIYKQVKGLAMGSPISGAIADIVLDDIIKNILDHNSFDILLITKYVDDLFLIVHQDDVEELFQAFNSEHKDFEFTMETENEDKIAYLDVELIRYENSIRHKWYKKPTNKGRLIDFWSSHPFHVKNNCIKAFAHRVLSLSHPVFHENCYKIIEDTLLKNHYPAKLIKKAINFAKYAPENTTRSTHENNPKIFHTITHCPPASLKIKRYLEGLNSNLKIIEKPFKKLSTVIYSNNKSKLDRLKKRHIVYKINCNDCEKCYIGHTSKRLEQRIKQHQNDCRLRRNKGFGTALSSHSLEYHHSFDFENPEILDCERNTFKRELKESIFIKKFQEKVVNFKVDTTRLHPIYHTISRKNIHRKQHISPNVQ